MKFKVFQMLKSCYTCSSSTPYMLDIPIVNEMKLTSEEKERNFNHNGAVLLEMQIASFEGKCKEPIKIYSEEDINRATSGYDPAMVVGRKFATVYRGNLEDRPVAIKTPQGLHGSEGMIEFFLNQVTIKQQISHQNVVQLYGCCLETHIPMLVHELTDGSLFDFLHGSKCWLSWQNRLRIATEIAYALSYLHSAGQKPLYAKLSNFGLSISIDPEETTQTWPAMGSLGYIDPEYVKTLVVTEKCDVYSSGVVLVEMLSGIYPADMQKQGGDIVEYFLSYMMQNSVVDIVDQKLLQEGRVKTTIEQFADLTSECVQSHGGRRPTMEDIVSKLRQM